MKRESLKLKQTQGTTMHLLIRRHFPLAIYGAERTRRSFVFRAAQAMPTVVEATIARLRSRAL
jgi:hypothetical protein